MRIVDTKGQLCPAPLIAVKRALRDCGENETFQVLIDNQTSFNNVSRFLTDNNTAFSSNQKGGLWTLTVTRGQSELSGADAENYCTDTVPHFKKGDFIIVITSDKMGEGDEELGMLLMGNFIKAVKDLDKLPEKMIFYNKGVTLVTNESPHINHIRDLEKMGVEIYLCATCVNHFKLAESVGTGTLGNMFTIAELMASAGNIIRP